MSRINTLYLDEGQNEDFDTEYHSAEELRRKVELISCHLPNGPRHILDIGGGNGNFIDRLLDTFPEANGVNLDISRVLLSRNMPHPRKELLCASVEQADALLDGRRFDVITLNWLLHHLVGPDYGTCNANCMATLRLCTGLLAPGGIIIVAENMFDGFWKTNVPSRVIYEITRIREPHFAAAARRYFNTSGVGVCFRCEHDWRRLFAESGLSTLDHYYGRQWSYDLRNRLMRAALFIASQRHGHFFLKPAA